MTFRPDESLYGRLTVATSMLDHRLAFGPLVHIRDPLTWIVHDIGRDAYVEVSIPDSDYVDLDHDAPDHGRLIVLSDAEGRPPRDRLTGRFAT